MTASITTEWQLNQNWMCKIELIFREFADAITQKSIWIKKGWYKMRDEKRKSPKTMPAQEEKEERFVSVRASLPSLCVGYLLRCHGGKGWGRGGGWKHKPMLSSLPSAAVTMIWERVASSIIWLIAKSFCVFFAQPASAAVWQEKQHHWVIALWKL